MSDWRHCDIWRAQGTGCRRSPGQWNRKRQRPGTVPCAATARPGTRPRRSAPTGFPRIEGGVDGLCRVATHRCTCRHRSRRSRSFVRLCPGVRSSRVARVVPGSPGSWRDTCMQGGGSGIRRQMWSCRRQGGRYRATKPAKGTYRKKGKVSMKDCQRKTNVSLPRGRQVFGANGEDKPVSSSAGVLSPNHLPSSFSHPT